MGCGTGIIQLALNVPPTFVFRAAELIWNQNAGKAPIVCLAFFFFFLFKSIGLVVYSCSDYAARLQKMHGALAFLQALHRKYMCVPVHAHSGRES